MKRTVVSSHPLVLVAALLLAACSSGRQFEGQDGGGGAGDQGGSKDGGGAGHAGTGGAAGHAGTSGSAGAAGGSAGAAGVGGGGTTGSAGATSSGGTIGAAGSSATGGAGVVCSSTQHNCSGTCVANNSIQGCGTTSCVACVPPTGATATCDGTGCGFTCPSGQHTCGETCVSNSSIQSCGTTSCTACVPPAGATATCDGTSCGYSCGSTTPKSCAAAMICIPSSGCCTNSDCPAMAGGQVGTCDSGTNTCNYNCAANMKSCTAGGATTCIPSSGCCTNADCTGTCVACSTSTHTCFAAVNVDDPNGRCVGTCDASGACKSKQGQTCNTVAGGCVGGTTCSPDGYCCNTACTGSCVACDLPGLQGTCTNLASGVAPHSNHPVCAGSGTCAGSCGSAGACVFPSSSCAGAICSGTSLVGPSSCSAGACVAPAAQVCPNELICSANACKTSCTTDTDCLPNYFCGGGSCHQAAITVAAGTEFSCAILHDGTVRCWGVNFNDQLGTGSSIATGLVPVEVTGLPAAATALALGADFGCALLSDGTVWCWGNDGLGQLGNGMFSTLGGPAGYAPAKVKNLGSPVTAIGAGYYHVCAAVNQASVWCWGDNGAAELGTGSATTTSPDGVNLPVQAVGVTGKITSVAANEEASYAFNSNDGIISSWGGSESGQLGNGSTSLATGIQDVGLTVSTLNVSAGTFGYMACAIGSDGAAYCWGDDSEGALGPGAPIEFDPNPVKITGLPSTVTAISAGAETICAILHNGALYCWGGNFDGQAGQPSSTPSFSTPTQVTGFVGTPTSVSSGYNHTCALMSDGSVWCWGDDNFGELGDGQTENSPTPIEALGW